MQTSDNPIICAIDTTDVEQARHLVTQVTPHVGAIKLGLEFFTANGAAGVNAVTENSLPVFLDLKFHDIPNTVSKAIKATAGINSYMMTIHTAGGSDMMRAAIDAANELAETTGTKRPLIVGVTILTSLDQQDLDDVGYSRPVSDQVVRMAELAQKSGLDGVVCSAHEIQTLRNHCGNDFHLVVPGIRPAGSASGDQKRTLTPEEAMQYGASQLVIGRPITQAPSPADTAKAIFESLC